MKKLLLLTVLILFLFPVVGAEKHSIFSSEARPENLSEQLDSLATRYDFDLVVHTDLSKAPPRAVAGNLLHRLDLLLSGFNHAIIESPQGKVEQVIVLSPKQPLPPAPDEIVLKMHRKGTHHLVRATLVGKNGAEIQSDLVIDTGSTFVVLPRSKITELAITPGQLTNRQVQTAKGRVTASIGRIPMIRIGGAEISDVEVAFIEDAKLGGNALLGMSILSRYKLILDDEKSTLTLILKE